MPKRSWHKDELLKLARNLRALSADLQDAVKKWLGKNKGSQEARKSIRDKGYKELRNRRQQLLDIAKFEVLLNAEVGGWVSVLLRVWRG